MEENTEEYTEENTVENTEDNTEENTEENTVFSCALEGDLDGLLKCIDDSKAVDSEESVDIFKETDEVGRNALLAACMLGRSNVVRELVVRKYADVNTATARGYLPLHYSAMWNQLDTLKTLIELGADLQAVNFRGEKALDVALRYSKMDCIDYLAWADAKQSLDTAVTEIKDKITVQDVLNKEEKNLCSKTLAATSAWIQKAKNPTTEDFVEQRKHLESVLASILTKLTAQSEVPSKTSKN